MIQHRNFEIYQIFKKKMLMSEHAILVKVVLRESMLETAILQNSNDFIEFVCSDIELNCFKYGHTYLLVLVVV